MSTPEEKDSQEDLLEEAIENIEENEDEDEDSEDVQKAEDLVTDNLDEVIINQRVQVFPESPLKYLDRGEIKAYAAKSLTDNAPLIAYVCQPHIPPRFKSIPKYKSIINFNAVKNKDRGVVYWPPSKAERYIFVYEKELGNPVLEPGKPLALGWKYEKVLENIIVPFIHMLNDFRDKDFVHGNINIHNVYESANRGRNDLFLLGDPLTTPPFYHLDALHRPIPMAMADQISPGIGTRKDDMYSFGVMLAIMLRDKDPFDKASREKIIKSKIENGTFNTLLASDRLKPEAIDLLRGLLHDNPEERMTTDEAMLWLEGKRTGSRQPLKYKKANRPLEFGGKEYQYPALLAMDLQKNPSELQTMIENGTLQQWLKRAFEKNEMLDELEVAIARAAGEGPSNKYEHRLASFVSCVLDKWAPFRYRGMSIMPDTIGYSLSNAAVMQQDLTPYAEIFNGTFLNNWIIATEAADLDKSDLLSKFDNCKRFLSKKTPGYGIERCIYELSPNIHCLSEKLSEYIVQSPLQLVIAFERKAKKEHIDREFLDRHSVAFLMARDAHVAEKRVQDLGSDIEHERLLANLKVISEIARREAIAGLIFIGKAFSGMMNPIIERFHDRETRKKLKKELERFANAGKLEKMVALLEDKAIRKRDYHDFYRAFVEFKNLEKEQALIEKDLENKDTYGFKTAAQVALLVALLISSMIIAAVAFTYIEGGKIM